MKVLVIGANGFIGGAVSSQLDRHQVYRAGMGLTGGEKTFNLDLTDQENIKACLKWANPDVILNCAGIVANDESANLNVVFTTNLLTQVSKLTHKLSRVIVTGSAAEYGEVDPNDLPVPETAPIKPTSVYGRSKAAETMAALKFRDDAGLPVVIIRIFNPIGTGMHPRLLLPNLIRQVAECEAGSRRTIEVSRLDAKRDYVAVSDVARAIKLLAEGDPELSVYNIGSGISTSNAQLVELILGQSKLKAKPSITETSGHPEPPAASQADITRLASEFNWRPETSLTDVIKDIINASN